MCVLWTPTHHVPVLVSLDPPCVRVLDGFPSVHPHQVIWKFRKTVVKVLQEVRATLTNIDILHQVLEVAHVKVVAIYQHQY